MKIYFRIPWTVYWIGKTPLGHFALYTKAFDCYHGVYYWESVGRIITDAY